MIRNKVITMLTVAALTTGIFTGFAASKIKKVIIPGRVKNVPNDAFG